MTDDKRCETCRYHTPHCNYADKVKLTGKKGCDAWQLKVQSVADGKSSNAGRKNLRDLSAASVPF